MIEVLIASLILTVCLAAIVHWWFFAYNMTISTAQKGIAYSIGRRRIEKVKETGFYNTPLSPASTAYYYDGAGGNESATQVAASVFKATTAVSCNPASVTVPADTALITVVITVTFVSSGQTLYQTSTTLVRAGI